jgi:hypothetical protein
MRIAAGNTHRAATRPIALIQLTNQIIEQNILTLKENYVLMI